ncbi:hypothetical protein SAMN05421663_10311 [Terribacillus halophilus]|uniref:Uncharacterized protein n=1 Tax=Terribacillus halophilus TaxID=361279 RepID=A0A1G6MQ68_9BACI|nr:hypothetical protein [Terribacillus halophilus]SDC57126.1 hypothetical protein SAMN05421663_10311 [Terribacillus halophilus]
MKKITHYFYVTCFLFLITGCQQQQNTGEEKVIIYVMESVTSPVQGFTVTLAETGEEVLDIGIILEPTDTQGKTEAVLKVGTTYEASLVLNDHQTQYEKITVSEDADDNIFTFVLDE